MAFLQPLTANITPHPAPVAPLAEQRWQRRGEWGIDNDFRTDQCNICTSCNDTNYAN